MSSDMFDVVERSPQPAKYHITETTESSVTESTEIIDTFRSPSLKSDGNFKSHYWRDGWSGFDRKGQWHYPASLTSSSGINMSSPDLQLLELDDELLRQLNTPDQIASMASSYINQQILLHSHCRLTMKEMDQIVKVMQDVAVLEQEVLLKFIVEYNRCLHQCATSAALHGPVIRLLLDVLLVSLDPVENVIVCLQLLSIFAQFTQNLTVMIECQVAATVMGVMAVHAHHPLVQHHGCTILGQIATYQQLPHKKPAVGESGAELLLRAIKNHKKNIDVIRPAIKALSNITANLTSVTSCSPTQNLSKQGQSQSVETESLESSGRYLVIDYIQSFVLPLVEEMMLEYCQDSVVLGEGSKMRTALKIDSSTHSEEDASGSKTYDESKGWTFFKWKSKTDVKPPNPSTSTPTDNRQREQKPVSPPRQASTPSTGSCHACKHQENKLSKSSTTTDSGFTKFDLDDFVATPPFERAPSTMHLISQDKAGGNANTSTLHQGFPEMGNLCYLSDNNTHSPQSTVFTMTDYRSPEISTAAPYGTLNESMVSEDSVSTMNRKE